MKVPRHISSYIAAIILTLTGPTLADNSKMDARPTADASQEAEKSPEIKVFESLDFKTESIDLGIATLKLGHEFVYLDQKDSSIFLEKLWGNPPGFDGMGMIFSKDRHPLSGDAWAIVISFEESGYVSDEDAHDMDFEELLDDMKESLNASNPSRVEQGYEPIELVGWAETPFYDSEQHKIYWAKELKFGENPEHHTLNYNIRVLGRRGVLNLNAVGNMGQLEDIKKARPTILEAINFNEGHKYTDFDPSTDKIAQYGLAALIAGGALAKSGLLKTIVAGLLAGKKFILIGLVGLGSFFMRLFGRKKES